MNFPYIFKTKSGQSVVIRPPESGDTPALLEFINTLSKEQTYITFQGEQLTLKEEQSFVKNQIKKIKNHEAVQLLALDDNRVVANTSIELGVRVNHHLATFAIAISAGYRNEGLGSILLNLLLESAKENLPDLKIVELKVFANNPKAKHLYEKFGFKEYGLLPKGALYKGEYLDEIMMYREV